MNTSSFITGYDEEPLTPAGEIVGTLCTLAPMGVQPGDFGDRPQLYAEFEVTCPDGTVRKIDKLYHNFSFHPGANFRLDVEAIFGRKLTADEARQVDIQTLIGKACLLTIEHRKGKKGFVHANVTGIAPLPPGVSPPQLVGKPLLFDINNPDNAALVQLPTRIQKAIRIHVEPAQKVEPDKPNTAASEPEEFDNAIPF
jgi:hypothetical protein